MVRGNPIASDHVTNPVSRTLLAPPLLAGLFLGFVFVPWICAADQARDRGIAGPSGRAATLGSAPQALVDRLCADLATFSIWSAFVSLRQGSGELRAHRAGDNDLTHALPEAQNPSACAEFFPMPHRRA